MSQTPFPEGLSIFVTVWETPTGPIHPLTFFIDTNGNKVIDVNELNKQFKQYNPSVPDQQRHYGYSPDYNGRMLYSGGPTFSLWHPAKASLNDIYFQEGLLPWGTRGKIGYVDKKGVIVIPPTFTYAGHFSRGDWRLSERVRQAETKVSLIKPVAW